MSLFWLAFIFIAFMYLWVKLVRAALHHDSKEREVFRAMRRWLKTLGE